MGKITLEFEAMYDRGDVVIFEKNGGLEVGIITSYYCDAGAGYSIWYDIAIWKDKVYTYASGGDIGEHSILCKLSEKDVIEKITKTIHSGEIYCSDDDD